MKQAIMRPAYFAGMLLCFGLQAQTADTNSITVFVSRSVSIPAEQVPFQLTAVSDPAVTLSTVQTALQASGVSGATFSGVANGTNTTGSPASSWSFTLQVPYAKLNDEFAILQKAVQSLAAGTPRLTLSFSFGSSLVSDATLQDAQKKLLPDLMSDAKRKATALADAAGLGVGQILSISDSASTMPGTPTAVLRTGDFTFYNVYGNASSTVVVTYAITVKFAALRYS